MRYLGDSGIHLMKMSWITDGKICRRVTSLHDQSLLMYCEPKEIKVETVISLATVHSLV